jgi:hypothetical protein
MIDGYVIELYCDNKKRSHTHNNAGFFSGVVKVENCFRRRDRTQAIRAARTCGWVFGNDGLLLCPVCKKYGYTLRQVRDAKLASED